MIILRTLFSLVALGLIALSSHAQPAEPQPDITKILAWRSIGPANMGGRVTGLAVFEGDPSTWYVATASGGLLKTVNNGSTFEHQFDREKTVSIGAVAVAPTNRNIVWIGTGEANPRNSVSYGDGVYLSTDGGKSWKNKGLAKTYQISRIVIHPKNPDIVYVGALGRLYGPNEERGLFKTIDAGKTWQKIHFVNDKTGVMDIVMNPADPEMLIIATWERQRDAFDSFRGDAKNPPGGDVYSPTVLHAPGSGMFKTIDGGKTWAKITTGIPRGNLGRIGLDWHQKNSKLLYAVIDSEHAGKGVPPAKVVLGITPQDTPKGVVIATVSADGPSQKAGLAKGDLLLALDGKTLKSSSGISLLLQGKFGGDKIKVTYQRNGEKREVELTLAPRPIDPNQRGSLGLAVDDSDKGVIVSKVFESSVAEQAGIKVGDLLLTIDGMKIDNPRVLFKAIFPKKAGDKVALSYLRGKDKKDLQITLEPMSSGTSERPYAGRLGGQIENIQDKQGAIGNDTGGVYKSTDGGDSWTRVNSINERPFYFSTVKSDPNDENTLYFLGIYFYRSTDGGKTFDGKGINKGLHADHHDLWINPKDSRNMIIGTDGGFYVTHDRAANWEHLNHFALGQYYHVTVDNRKPYNVYGGLQDNGTWGGPSHSLRSSGVANSDVRNINGGDGFVCRVDPADPDLVYAESQDGMMMRRNLRTGQSWVIRPKQQPNLGTLRFNWCTPFILSHHNSHIFYCAGNYVFRSVKQGADLQAISPEITLTKRGSATAIEESPKDPDILWVGTDDGAVHVTRDGGKKWVNVTDKFKPAGLPGPRWVSSIEPSRSVAGRCYVVFDGHRSDDDEPYVFVTEDFGQTWRSLRANLPIGTTRVLREDRVNPELLYLGTEFALFGSLDRGGSWTSLNGNTLPTVAIHEIAQATTAPEIVVGTHGRSIWVLDVTTLRQMKKSHFTEVIALYTPTPLTLWRLDTTREGMFRTGTRAFTGQNPPRTVTIDFSLPKKIEKLTLKVVDVDGTMLREVDLTKESGPGLHRVSWDLSTGTSKKGPPTGKGLGKGKAGKGPNAGPASPFVGAGRYRIVLEGEGVELARTVTIEGDPRLPDLERAVDEAEEEHAIRRWLKGSEP